MTLLAIDFNNLHQILRDLYVDMMPLCADLVGVAKGVAGLGALFYVAYRVWQALSRAEPIDVFPLLRPFAIGLCIMFFPVFVIGTINTVMSPVVKGCHTIMEKQMEDVTALQTERDNLEYAARVREGKEWLVDEEVYEQKLSELGIRQLGTEVSMRFEHAMYKFKTGLRELISDFFELLFHAAALSIDTIRTFFLVVLAILGPLSFALSIYDGFQSTLTAWLSRYISVYLWLPVSDIFSAVLSKIQALMLKSDIALLQDPTYVPDGVTGMYIIFLIIGIIGYFTVPTVANWIISAGGNSGTRGINAVAAKTGGMAGGLAGAAAGNVAGRLFGKK